MSLLETGPDSIVWVQPAVTCDDLGEVEYDYDPAVATRTTVTGAWIQQTSTAERVEGGATVITRAATLFARFRGISGHDRFEQGDSCFEVDGQPREVATPRGFHHVEATLVQVKG